MKTRKVRYKVVSAKKFDDELRQVRAAHSKRETFPISDRDHIHVRIDFGPTGGIIAFAIQYEYFLNGRWRPIKRIDATSKEVPHQHSFHREDPRKDQKEVLVAQSHSYNKIFHESLKRLKKDFEEYKERYLSEV